MNYKDTFMQWLFKLMFTIISTKTISVVLTFYALVNDKVTGTQFMVVISAFLSANIAQKYLGNKEKKEKECPK